MNVRPTPSPKPPRMTADEFFAWAEEQPEGRYELVDGEVAAMGPERVIHGRVKARALVALSNAVAARGLRCEAFGDGMSVRVADDAVYEPDALLRCGPDLPPDALELNDPLVVVEVLSPSTRHVDTGKKLTGYFLLPSVRHYLVLDADKRTVIHYQRTDGQGIAMQIHHARPSDGELVLDPPGLSLSLADLFEAP